MNQIGNLFRNAVFGLAVLVAAPAHHALAQVVALGDSNIAGPGLSSSESYPGQLQAALVAHGRNVSVSNAGVMGDTSAQVLDRVDNAVPSGTRVVVLWVGINDVRRGMSPATTASNIAAITSKLRARNIAVYRVPMGVANAAHTPNTVMPDRMHLNAAGQAKVVAATLPAIERLLR